MKTHKKTINGKEIESWNDSNSSWVVCSKENGRMSFDKRKFTMKEAIKFYCEIWSI